MARFGLQDFKKQASFFLREKLNDARLAITNVSRIQLLTEEATNEDSWGPETKTMATLADAAFELEEYERIVQVLHSRLELNKKRHWRQLYKTLVVMEYLLTHGPNSLGREFREDITSVEELSQFNFTDQQGIDRGSIVQKTADRVLDLLSNPDFRKEERARVAKISVGIQGFGSNINQELSQNATKDNRWSCQGDSKNSPSNELSEVGNAAKKTSQHESQLSPDGKSVVAMYPQVMQDISNNLPDEENVLALPKVSKEKAQVKVFKKSSSSPGLFRERAPYLSLQPADDVMNELEEVNTCLLHAVEEREFPSCADLQGGREEPGKLMRWISEELPEEGMTDDRNMNKSMFEGIFAENRKSPMQECNDEQLFLNSPKCHDFPYPEHPKSREKFQHQWQVSNLIDCSSK